MTTLEFMEKELNKCKINLEHQIARNAPADNIENIKNKITHYEKVCELLKGEVKTMNIYWCVEKNDYSGLYVIAETRGRAKQMFAAAIDEPFVDIRTHICRKNVTEKAGVIYTDQSDLLEKYNLEYDESDIPDNWLI